MSNVHPAMPLAEFFSRVSCVSIDQAAQSVGFFFPILVRSFMV